MIDIGDLINGIDKDGHGYFGYRGVEEWKRETNEAWRSEPWWEHVPEEDDGDSEQRDT